MPRQAGSCSSCQTLGSAGMQSRTPMNIQHTLSGRNANALTSQAATVAEVRASAPKFESASARAVRPLAASARPQRFVAGSGLCPEPSLSREEEAWLPKHSFLGRTKNPMPTEAKALLCPVTAVSRPMRALRRRAKPNTRGRAGTRCCAARAGGFGLLAGSATQRTMHAGRGVRAALPNPSIEGDVQGLSPLAAPHVKR
jgi:hypothetical protein